MTTRTSALRLAFVLLLISAGACHKNAPETSLATLRHQGFDGAYEKIFVMGIGENDDRRRLYEESLVEALKNEGTDAQPSYRVFPQTEKLDREMVLQAVTEGGFDAVALTHVIWVSNELEWVEGERRELSGSDADLYMNQYEEAYEIDHEPGYYVNHARYSVETMVYSVAQDGTKTWSALSETVNPSTVESLIDAVVEAVVRGMKTDGVIR